MCKHMKNGSLKVGKCLHPCLAGTVSLDTAEIVCGKDSAASIAENW